MGPDSIMQVDMDVQLKSRNKGRIAMPYTRRYNPAISPWDILLTFPICDPIDKSRENFTSQSIGSYFGSD
jgi:hypothetical protein